MIENTYPKNVVLKDGTEVTLMPMNRKNMDQLVDFYASLSNSDQWFLTEDTLNPEVIKGWVENQGKGNSFCIVATLNELVVAHASLLMRRYGGRNRIGRLRIMVAREFQQGNKYDYMIMVKNLHKDWSDF